MYGNMLWYIAHVMLLKCENVCEIDIAGPNMQGGDNIEIPPTLVCMFVCVFVCSAWNIRYYINQ